MLAYQDVFYIYKSLRSPKNSEQCIYYQPKSKPTLVDAAAPMDCCKSQEMTAVNKILKGSQNQILRCSLYRILDENQLPNGRRDPKKQGEGGWGAR
jgi:hypothetical protein